MRIHRQVPSVSINVACFALLIALAPKPNLLAQLNAQNPPQTVPQPNSAPNPPRELSTEEVEQQIQKKLRSEPALTKFDIRATASESAITLTGIVDSEQDRALAAGIAESFAGKRKIIDNITLRPGESPQP